jgi:apolipoprotein N-acyltransferase
MSQTPMTGAFDRTERTGSPALVLIFAVVFVSAALASAFLPPEQGGRVTIALLAVLAVVLVLLELAVLDRDFLAQHNKDILEEQVILLT